MMQHARGRRAAVAVGTMFAALGAVSPASWAAADTTPPSVPNGFRVLSATETTLTVEWSPSTDASGVPQYWAGAMGGSSGQVHATAEPRYTFTGLTPDRPYSIMALAVDGAGNYSVYGTSSGMRTRPDTAAPSIPAGIRVTPTLGHATVSWSAASDNHRVDRYEVSVDGASVRPISTSQTAAEVRNMAPASTHTFALRSVDASGNRSAWSAPIRLTMPDAPDRTPPAAPTGLRLAGDLLWNATTDDADGPDGLEYAVYADGTEFAFVGHHPRFETFDPFECVDTLLGGTHTYSVRATDSSGNVSPPSNALVLTR